MTKSIYSGFLYNTILITWIIHGLNSRKKEHENGRQVTTTRYVIKWYKTERFYQLYIKKAITIKWKKQKLNYYTNVILLLFLPLREKRHAWIGLGYIERLYSSVIVG
jgi:hypothetical protein